MIKVEYSDHMGSDLSVVNAARRSFNKTSDWEYRCLACGETDLSNCKNSEKPNLCHGVFAPMLNKKDEALIRYLARGVASPDWDQLLVDVRDCPSLEEAENLINSIRGIAQHDSPLNSCALSLNVSVPIFVARQLTKHEYLCWSEASRRYITEDVEFYEPVWREAPEDKKQGSGPELTKFTARKKLSIAHFRYATESCGVAYDDLIEEGFAPEQARMILPQNMMVEATWTGLLGAWVKFINLRDKPDVQKETREVAQKVKEIASKHFPVSIREFCK